MIEELKTDYCIVGAGIAGLMVASRLARTGRDVLIIDQGPDVTHVDRTRLLARVRHQFRYDADYDDDVDKDILTPTSGAAADRLFGTGGTALHFGGWMVRPIEQDHSVKKLYGYGRNWPLSYAELEPWLVEAEYETGVPGKKGENRYASFRSRDFPMKPHAFSWFDRTIFRPALEKLEMQGHSAPFAVTTQPYQHREYAPRRECAGHRFCKFCPTGARYSPDRVHGAWLQTLGVRIRNGVSLRRLEMSADGNSVVAGLARRVDTREEVVIKARHFVLAMGGVATTRMLMLSKGGTHAHGIGNAGGQLGQGLMDHLNSVAIMELDRHVGGALGFPTMQSDHGRTVPRDKEPSWIMFAGAPFEDVPVGEFVVPWATENDRIDLERLRETSPRVIQVFAMHEMTGTGRLDLDPKLTDTFKDPIARFDLPASDRDRLAAGQFEKLAHDLGEHMRARKQKILTPTPACYYGHPAGTTAMGTSLENGVCDSDCKVFGVDNLHLASISVFPHMGANPPTLTIAALALRLGAHLEDR